MEIGDTVKIKECGSIPGREGDLPPLIILLLRSLPLLE